MITAEQFFQIIANASSPMKFDDFLAYTGAICPLSLEKRILATKMRQQKCKLLPGWTYEAAASQAIDLREARRAPGRAARAEADEYVRAVYGVRSPRLTR